jgi:hypothetical protein
MTKTPTGKALHGETLRFWEVAHGEGCGLSGAPIDFEGRFRL